MSSAEIATRYQELVVKNLLLENAVDAAMAYLNLGEIAKAQNLLQGAMLDAQITNLKGASNGNAAA